MTMTQHNNCILNPDIVTQWAADEPQRVNDRYERAKALLPNMDKYFNSEYPRARKAIELWALAIGQ